MFIRNIFIIVFFIYGITNMVYSQQLHSDTIKYYQFKLCNSPQTITLIENKHNKFYGFISTHLEKERKSGIYREIKKQKKISSEKVKKIILELNNNKIDSINKNYDDDDLSYLDGDDLSIILLRNKKIEKFSFDEIYPINSKKIEQTSLRKKIQNWLTIIDEELNLKKELSDLIKKLKKGKYCYWSGISKVCINKKKTILKKENNDFSF